MLLRLPVNSDDVGISDRPKTLFLQVNFGDLARKTLAVLVQQVFLQTQVTSNQQQV